MRSFQLALVIVDFQMGAEVIQWLWNDVKITSDFTDSGIAMKWTDLPRDYFSTKNFCENDNEQSGFIKLWEIL
jgi:hypothetical protein